MYAKFTDSNFTKHENKWFSFKDGSDIVTHGIAVPSKPVD